MNQKIKLALIYGSTREGRFCETVARWAAKHVAGRNEFAVDVIDPGALTMPNRHEDQYKRSAELSALKRRIEHAEAFIVVTPEYNHGYPAALKFLIDSIYAPWQAKPVAFVSYGGTSGGIRAVEQLRQVFAELHAVTIRENVAFANAWEQFDGGGELLAPDRANQSMASLLAQLHWWAVALRDARWAAPYAQVVA